MIVSVDKILGYRVLVKPKEEQVSQSGLITEIEQIKTDGKIKNSTIVDVVGVAECVYEVKPGDTVVIQDFAGDEVQHNGELHYLVDVLDILGILED